MAGHGKPNVDSPAGYNGSKEPGGALKMPVKHYPSSTKMATEGKKNTIEGPCEGDSKGYHK